MTAAYTLQLSIVLSLASEISALRKPLGESENLASALGISSEDFRDYANSFIADLEFPREKKRLIGDIGRIRRFGMACEIPGLGNYGILD